MDAEHLVINCRSGNAVRVDDHERADAEAELDRHADQAAAAAEAAMLAAQQQTVQQGAVEQLAAALARDPQVLAALAAAFGAPRTETP